MTHVVRPRGSRHSGWLRRQRLTGTPPSSTTLVGPQVVVAVAVVSWVDRHAGGDDLVNAVEDVRAEGEICGWEERLELLHCAGSDDGCGHAGVVDDKRDGHLDERDAGLLREERQLLDGVSSPSSRYGCSTTAAGQGPTQPERCTWAR